jgi:hypothetical protein
MSQLTLAADGVSRVAAHVAADLVIRHHYLHRRPNIVHAFGSTSGSEIVAVCTFGLPASRHLQLSACSEEPDLVIELNRLWVRDDRPKNAASEFVGRCLRLLPPLIVVSYADLAVGHAGYVYRALNFNYAGWTDMERLTPRWDYIASGGGHSRDAFRNGFDRRERRTPKVKYWTTSGDRRQRRLLARKCSWPSLDWHDTPPPEFEA